MRHKVILVSAVSLLALAACSSDVKQSLGVKKKGPDAFTVVAQPPLEMPPEFSLRPPRPGAPRPQMETQEERAVQILRETSESNGKTDNVETSKPAAQSASDSGFLKRAGAESADTSIRDKLNAESAQQAEEKKDKNFIQKMLPDKKAKAELLDPVEESKRLGQPVPGTEGVEEAAPEAAQ